MTLSMNGYSQSLYAPPYGSSGYGLGGYRAEYGSAALSPLSDTGSAKETGTVKNPGESDVKRAGRKSSPAECETCKERKYQDGSDEMVSFKSAAHVSPAAAGSAVRAHEQEHVSNAYKKAALGNGQVLQASVRIKTAVCPECGRTYVSGGETTTQIKYANEDNPYQKQRKQEDAMQLTGMHLDAVC